MIHWFSPHQIEAQRMRRLFDEAARKETELAEEMKPLEREAQRRYRRRLRLQKSVNKPPTTFPTKNLP